MRILGSREEMAKAEPSFHKPISIGQCLSTPRQLQMGEGLKLKTSTTLLIPHLCYYPIEQGTHQDLRKSTGHNLEQGAASGSEQQSPGCRLWRKHSGAASLKLRDS